MADTADVTLPGEWLVEHYEPGAGVGELRGRLGSVRNAAAHDETGDPVRLVVAAVVPGDEAILLVVAASSEERVRRVCLAGHLRLDRLTPVFIEPLP